MGEANKISRYNNIAWGASIGSANDGRSNKPCDWIAANPKFTRPSAATIRSVSKDARTPMDRLFIFPNHSLSSPLELCQEFTTLLQLTMKVVHDRFPRRGVETRYVPTPILREMKSRHWLKNGTPLSLSDRINGEITLNRSSRNPCVHEQALSRDSLECRVEREERAIPSRI